MKQKYKKLDLENVQKITANGKYYLNGNTTIRTLFVCLGLSEKQNVFSFPSLKDISHKSCNACFVWYEPNVTGGKKFCEICRPRQYDEEGKVLFQ